MTGASRGIGKASAVELARRGYDVAVTARTVADGEGRDHSGTVKQVDDSPLPGSLAATVDEIERAGGAALAVPADLLDRASLGAAVATVLERWGRVDVVVHSGRYVGPGDMDRFLDTPIDTIERQIEANVVAPLVIDKLVIPGMIERGWGMIVDITSAAGYADPTTAADGYGLGYGMGYGVSKGGFHRVAGFLDVELRDQGIYSFNVHPGLVRIERIAQLMADMGFDDVGASPEVIAAVVGWLATSDEAPALSGTTIEAQYFCHQRGLMPGWGGPTFNDNHIAYDQSGAVLARYEAALPRP
ncbi:MAG TPA: SDR family oxidoreductase [Acidimicrobiales bacterium]|nr:SDR family oxidoreductase [Acidimicrobiales bacterium]